jgi:hypothetical protein
VDIPGLEPTLCFDYVRMFTICWEYAMSNKFRRVRKEKYAAKELPLALIHQDQFSVCALFPE